MRTEPLPDGWSEAELLALCSSVTDGDHQAPPKVPDGIPFLVIGNINTGRLNLDASRFVPVNYYDALDPTRSPRRGDVLYSVTGSFGIPALVDTDKPFAVQRHIAIIRPADGVSSALLAYALETPEVFAQAVKVATGTAQKTVPLGGLRRFRIRVPPGGEQPRLVGALDSYLSRLDDVVATLERVQRNLKRYRASVLKAAVEGRLVPTEAELARKEGRDFEPADVLLRRILEERKARWIEEAAEKARARAEKKAKKAGKPWSDADDQAALEKGRKAAAKKYEEPEPPDTSELPELPEGWCWATVEQLASHEPRSIQSGPFGSNLLHSEFTSEGRLVIGIDNVQEGHFSMGSRNRITPTKFDELAKYQARPGDVLVTVMATVGRCCVVPQDIEPAIITKHVYRVTPHASFINSQYLKNALWGGPVVRNQMFGQVRGQTRPGLNGTIIKGLAIPVPPLPEQNRIVEATDRALSKAADVVSTAERNGVRASRLRQSILKWAFEGRLVDQDPNDEPASALLERIAAEREQAEAKNGKKKRRRKARKKKTTA